MHPGPFNRVMKITNDILLDPRCKIWDQVYNGFEVKKNDNDYNGRKKIIKNQI